MLIKIIFLDRENDVVILKKRGPISLIGINRPAKKNALNYDTALGIEKALTAVEQDGTTKAAVLYGERGNLCCGYDLDELDSDPSMIEKIKELVSILKRSLLRVFKFISIVVKKNYYW